MADETTPMPDPYQPDSGSGATRPAWLWWALGGLTVAGLAVGAVLAFGGGGSDQGAQVTSGRDSGNGNSSRDPGVAGRGNKAAETSTTTTTRVAGARTATGSGQGSGPAGSGGTANGGGSGNGGGGGSPPAPPPPPPPPPPPADTDGPSLDAYADPNPACASGGTSTIYWQIFDPSGIATYGVQGQGHAGGGQTSVSGSYVDGGVAGGPYHQNFDAVDIYGNQSLLTVDLYVNAC